MTQLQQHDSPIAQFHQLVVEAEDRTHLHLNEESESYLVFLLMRFSKSPRFAATPVAIDYLQCFESTGRVKIDQLRDVGDKCLLLSGFFPEQAEKRLVTIGYFINLGRTAYHEISTSVGQSVGELYLQLARQFVELMDILQSIRLLDSEKGFDPLLAMDLIQECGNSQARESLAQVTNATPVFIKEDERIQH